MSTTTSPRRDRRPSAAADAPDRAVGRFADLEGYRGLAAVAIVVFHVLQYGRTSGPLQSTAGAHALQGLDGFVDLFFVLSAFLLTLPFARSALAGEGAPSGRAFLLRRGARVIPLYAVAVLVVWAVRNPVLPGDLRDLVEHLTFTQVYDQQRIFYTIGPAWSLAVEVQFYVLLAVLGALACRWCAAVRPGARLAVLLGVVGAVGAAGVAWTTVAWYVVGVPDDHWPTWFGLPAKLPVFAVGMLLAVVVAHGRVRVGRAGSTWLRLGGTGVVVVAVLTRPQGAGPDVWFHLVAAVGFVLLLAASVLGPGGRWGRLLASPVPTFLGVVSYSLYLWHEPVLLALADLGWFPAQDSPLVVVVGAPLLCAVSLAVAWVSYHVIELPTRGLGTLLERDGTRREYYDGS